MEARVGIEARRRLTTNKLLFFNAAESAKASKAADHCPWTVHELELQRSRLMVRRIWAEFLHDAKSSSADVVGRAGSYSWPWGAACERRGPWNGM